MVKRKTLFVRLVWPYLILVLISLTSISWLGSSSLREFYIRQLTRQLESQANLIKKQVVVHFKNSYEEVDRWCIETGNLSDSRITIIKQDGLVIGDSERDPAEMDNHANRPEVIEAYDNGIGSAIRFSTTLQQEMLYVAIPHTIDEQNIIIRTALPLTEIYSTLRGTTEKILIWGGIAAILATILTLFIAQRIARPLQQMKLGAERFAREDLETKLIVPPIEELAALAESLNHMSTRLDERFHTIIRQREEHKAILSGMVEGVIAVNSDGRIIILNHAASVFIGVDAKTTRGELLQDAIPNKEMRLFFKKVQEQPDVPIAQEFILVNETERIVQAHGAPIVDSSDQRIGAVVVLNDITHIREVEQTRRDFIANASHELRTPVTAIKGFLDTLSDGNDHAPQDVEKFLKIMSRQADHLIDIIEDMLSLARLEQSEESQKISFEDENVCEILREVKEICEPQANIKKQIIYVECSKDLVVKLNKSLIQQAILNLVDNSMKYCPDKTRIRINCESNSDNVVFNVDDNGPGIGEEHYGRIFERFYRVDKSRSRKSGGTGLGLAIVKHIAIIHDGAVELNSRVNEGSNFSIIIPQNQ